MRSSLTSRNHRGCRYARAGQNRLSAHDSMGPAWTGHQAGTGFPSRLNNKGPGPYYLPIKVEDGWNHCAAILVLAKPAARSKQMLSWLRLADCVRGNLLGVQQRQIR